MIDTEAIHEAWQEASAGADAEEPTFIRWLERSCEFLVPVNDDGEPTFIRCRCCGSVSMTGLGMPGTMPDSNLGIHITVSSPCGHCRPHLTPRSLTIQGVRDRYEAGQTLGIGGRKS